MRFKAYYGIYSIYSLCIMSLWPVLISKNPEFFGILLTV